MKDPHQASQEKTKDNVGTAATTTTTTTVTTSPTNRNGSNNNNSTIRIVPIEDKHLPQLVQVFNDAFESKRCCCLLFSGKESLREVQYRYSSMPDAKRKLGFVAVEENENDDNVIVLGFAQLTTHGLPVYPSGSHVCQKNELYLETMAVSAEARGRGVGTKLLNWCIETASRSGTLSLSSPPPSSPPSIKLSLAVLRGNRAIGLYERVGFQKVPADACDECCSTAIVFCFMGRPYGICNPEWGIISMEMQVMERE